VKALIGWIGFRYEIYAGLKAWNFSPDLHLVSIHTPSQAYANIHIYSIAILSAWTYQKPLGYLLSSQGNNLS